MQIELDAPFEFWMEVNPASLSVNRGNRDVRSI